MELVTPRLLLREFREPDLEAIHAYAGDPEVTRFMDWGPNRLADTVAFLAEVRGESQVVPRVAYTLAVVVGTAGDPIGAVHLEQTSSVHRRGEMG